MPSVHIFPPRPGLFLSYRPEFLERGQCSRRWPLTKLCQHIFHQITTPPQASPPGPDLSSCPWLWHEKSHLHSMSFKSSATWLHAYEYLRNSSTFLYFDLLITPGIVMVTARKPFQDMYCSSCWCYSLMNTLKLKNASAMMSGIHHLPLACSYHRRMAWSLFVLAVVPRGLLHGAAVQNTRHPSCQSSAG